MHHPVNKVILKIPLIIKIPGFNLASGTLILITLSLSEWFVSVKRWAMQTDNVSLKLFSSCEDPAQFYSVC